MKHKDLLSVLCPLLIPALLVVGASRGWADEETDSWQPPHPKADAYDWVQLTSGEWLKGEIIAMYSKRLEFDSEKLNLQTLKWKDVKELRSANAVQVGLDDGSVVVGTILLDGETLRFLGSNKATLPRSEINTITPGAPKEINNWNTKVSLGANLRSGNTEQLETTVKGDLVRRTAKSRFNLSYLAAFNQTDGVKATDNQRATAGWNRYYSKRLFWSPLYAEWYRDPFQNISSRATVGTGLGFEIIDRPEVSWEASGGLAYQRTQFDSVAEGEATTVNTPAFVAGTKYNHELTGWLDLVFNYDFMFVNEDSGSFTHHLLTGLEFEITKILDFEVTFSWDHIRNPQEDSEGVVPEHDDYRLVFFLGLDF